MLPYTDIQAVMSETKFSQDSLQSFEILRTSLLLPWELRIEVAASQFIIKKGEHLYKIRSFGSVVLWSSQV